jgi:hypothetical protein
MLYALDDFPIIKELIGEAWFKSELEKDSKHPLIRYLLKGRPDFSIIANMKFNVPSIFFHPYCLR